MIGMPDNAGKNPLLESDNLEKDTTKMKTLHLPVVVVCVGRNLVLRQKTSRLVTQRIVHFLYLLINLNLCWKELLVLAILGQIWRVIDNHRQVLATHLIHLLCCYKVLICILYLHHFHHPWFLQPLWCHVYSHWLKFKLLSSQHPVLRHQWQLPSLPALTLYLQSPNQARLPISNSLCHQLHHMYHFQSCFFCQVSNKADQDLPRLSIWISGLSAWSQWEFSPPPIWHCYWALWTAAVLWSSNRPQPLV